MDMIDASIQNNLLRTLNQEVMDKKAKVISFNKPHHFEMGSNSLYTYSFQLSGEYNSILKVIHSIETQGKFGDIVHVDFQKKKNFATNKSNLGVTVMVQQIK